MKCIEDSEIYDIHFVYNNYAAKMYRRSTNFVINRVLLSNQNILRNVSKINIVSPFEKVDLEIPRKCVEDQRNLKISMI